MVDNDFDGGVLSGPLGFVVREHEANRAVLNGGLSVAVGGFNVVCDQAAVGGDGAHLEWADLSVCVRSNLENWVLSCSASWSVIREHST